MKHITVLAEEAVNALNLKSGSVVVDATLGAGGHAREILKHLGKDGIYIGIDADESAIDMQQLLSKETKATVHLLHANFRDIRKELLKLGILKVDAILADLGWSTDQFEVENKSKFQDKGFSFKYNEPLLMTYGDPREYQFTAFDIVNDWDEENIANIIYGYGGERYSRRIAGGIVEARNKTSIKTAEELAGIIGKAVPAAYRRGKLHPATKTFQALRIAVNDELGALEELLKDGFEALKPTGRMAIISFHSLEDRKVKETFKKYQRDQIGKIITKRPIKAEREEILNNPRARSARLRIIEKI